MSTCGKSFAGASYGIIAAAEKLGVTGLRVGRLCATGDLEAVEECGRWLLARGRPYTNGLRSHLRRWQQTKRERSSPLVPNDTVLKAAPSAG